MLSKVNTRNQLCHLFISKVANKERLTPENLYMDMNQILSLKRRVNITDVPNYKYLSLDGNEFNLPRRKPPIPPSSSPERSSSPPINNIRAIRMSILSSRDRACPTEIDEGGEEECQILCGTENATIIHSGATGFVEGLELQPNKKYCYVPKDKNISKGCSRITGQLVYSQAKQNFHCYCKYPFLFGGHDCTRNVACPYNNKKYRANPNWENEVYLVDEQNPEQCRIIEHEDMAQSTLLKKLESASLEEYITYINDKDFFLNHRISCQCEGQLDYLGNPVLPANNTNKYYTNFGKCQINPCLLTQVDVDRVVKYNKETYECIPQNPFSNMLKDRYDTPIAGSQAPLFGLRPRQIDQPYTSLALKQMMVTSSSKETMEIATMHASPIITPAVADHFDKNRFILYLSPDQINVGGKEISDKWFGVPTWYSMYGDCLPNITNNPISATMAFSIYPIENILTNYTPQNPVDFHLMASQALENSRMLSGIVVGGHECLFDSLTRFEQHNFFPKQLSMLQHFRETRKQNVIKSNRVTDYLKAAHFVRTYRMYGLFTALENLHDNYFINNSKWLPWCFPTSLYKLNPEEHIYPITQKINNSLSSKLILKGDTNILLSFGNYKSSSDYTKQNYDLYCFNTDINDKRLKHNIEFFGRGLQLEPSLINSSDIGNLSRKKVMPINLHHPLAEPPASAMYNNSISCRHLYSDMCEIASSITWLNSYNTTNFNTNTHFKEEE